MSLRITRFKLLRGGLALLGTAAAGPFLRTPAWAKPPPSGERKHPPILDLEFREQQRFRPFDLLPQRMVQVHARFDGSGVSQDLQVLAPNGSEQLAYQDGGLRVSVGAGGATLIRLGGSCVAPYATVIADTASLATRPESGSAKLLAGLVRDSGNYVVCGLAAGPDPTRSRVSIEVCVDGRITTAAALPADLTSASSFAFALNENFVTALVLAGSEWTPVVQHRVTELIDLRNPATLRDFQFGLGAVGTGSTPPVSTVRAGHFGQVGLRDLHVISTAEGRPLIYGRKLYLTATHAGLSFFQAAHWGVWTLDLDQPDRMELAASLFFERDGLLLGDHAGQIVFDEIEGGFHVAVSSWGDFDFKSVHVRYCRTFDDILSGVHVLRSEPLPLPTDVSAWDPAMARIDGRWVIGFTESPVQRPGGFEFHPALAASRAGGPITELSRIGADLSLSQTEGTILQEVDGVWSLLASDGEERRYRVYDLAMRPQGFLRATYGSNIPHPQVVPVPHKGRTAYLLLTFDGTPYREDVLGYGTHGDVIVMRAEPT